MTLEHLLMPGGDTEEWVPEPDCQHTDEWGAGLDTVAHIRGYPLHQQLLQMYDLL